MNRQERANLIKDRRRQAIIDTALRLFYENGVEKVKIDHIAKELGISHGLFYHYFKDKNELIDAIREMSKSMFVEDATKWAIENHTAYSFFRQLTEFVLDIIQNDITKLYILNFLLFCNYQELKEKQEVSKIFAKVIDLVKKDQEEGIFEDSLSYVDLILTYISTLQGIATCKIKKADIYGIPSVDAVMQIFLKKTK